MMETVTRPQSILDSIAKLFEALHQSDILYCNMKGNDQHLHYALTGQSDIDILFDASKKPMLVTLLHALNFKEFISIREKRFKDICDYFVLDPSSGRVLHLHAHFGLTIGQPFLKGYQPDIARQILHTRVYNDAYGLYTIHPAYEFVLLYLNETLKLRHRDAIGLLLNQNTSLGEKVVYQYGWLKSRTKPEEVESALQTLFGSDRTIKTLIASEFDKRQFQRLATAVGKAFAKYRLYAPLEGLLIRWQRELRIKFKRSLAGPTHLPIPLMRTNPRGGVIVSVIEPDEGQRAILFQSLKETFSKKIDLYQITTFTAVRADTQPKRRFLMYARSLLQACSKWIRSSKVELAKRNGSLVICDFDPDGVAPAVQPLLPGAAEAGATALCRLHTIVHRRLKELSSPDLVIQFTNCAPFESLSFGTSHLTTAETSTIPDRKKRRKTVWMDPSTPIDEKLHILKSEIWNVL